MFNSAALRRENEALRAQLTSAMAELAEMRASKTERTDSKVLAGGLEMDRRSDDRLELEQRVEEAEAALAAVRADFARVAGELEAERAQSRLYRRQSRVLQRRASGTDSMSSSIDAWRAKREMSAITTVPVEEEAEGGDDESDISSVSNSSDEEEEERGGGGSLGCHFDLRSNVISLRFAPSSPFAISRERHADSGLVAFEQGLLKLESASRAYTEATHQAATAGEAFSSVLREAGVSWASGVPGLQAALSVGARALRESSGYADVMRSAVEASVTVPIGLLARKDVVVAREELKTAWRRGREGLSAVEREMGGGKEAEGVVRKAALARAEAVRRVNELEARRRWVLAEGVCGLWYALRAYHSQCERALRRQRKEVAAVQRAGENVKEVGTRIQSVWSRARSNLNRELAAVHDRESQVEGVDTPSGIGVGDGAVLASSADESAEVLEDEKFATALDRIVIAERNMTGLLQSELVDVLKKEQDERRDAWAAKGDKYDEPPSPQVLALSPTLHEAAIRAASVPHHEIPPPSSPLSSLRRVWAGSSPQTPPSPSPRIKAPWELSSASAPSSSSPSPSPAHGGSGGGIHGSDGMADGTDPAALAGWLWKRSSKAGTVGSLGRSLEWQRRWFFVRDGALWYVRSPEDLAPRKVCDLVVSNARVAAADVPNVIELRSPGARVFHLQAPSTTSRRKWLRGLRRGAEAGILQAKRSSGTQNPKASSAEIQAILESNPTCADCGAPAADWTSINWGTILCISCSGVHRGLGTHVSKIRSLQLDSIDPATIQAVHRLGNATVNRVLQHSLDKGWSIPDPDAPRADRERFIRAKYAFKGFVEPFEAFVRDHHLEDDMDKTHKEYAEEMDSNHKEYLEEVDDEDKEEKLLKEEETEVPKKSSASSEAEKKLRERVELAEKILCVAAREANVLEMMRAIAHGANPQTASTIQALSPDVEAVTTPVLHLAAFAGDPASCEFLLQNGAPIGAPDGNGQLAVARARESTSETSAETVALLVRWMVDAGIPVE